MRVALAKITRPGVAGVVPRRRLFRQLDVRRSLTWVWGPPGAGKTALVSSWLEARHPRHVWYRCDRGDTDVAMVLEYVARAARYRGRLAGTTDRTVREFVRALFSRLRVPFVVVLDDYHEVPPDSPMHQLVREAVVELPPGARLVAISRAEAPGVFARLRASQALREIGWTDLCLTLPEARAIAHKIAPRTPAMVVDDAHTRAAGWAAGLVLMLGQRRRLAGERRRAPDAIADYFSTEVLARVDASTRELLLKTAVLPRMTGAMAEALTGQSEAGRVLTRLCRTGCFTAQRVDQAAMYEYHPLFRAFLLRRVHALLSPEARKGLQRRAAELLEAEGQLDEAAALLTAAGEWSGLARLVESCAPTLATKEHDRRIAGWIAAIPEETIGERPWLLFWRAAGGIAITPAAARRDLEAALTHFRQVGSASGAFRAWALAVLTFLFEEEEYRSLDGWIADLGPLLAQFPQYPSLEIETRVAASMVLALVCRQPGHPDVRRWTARTRELIEAADDPELRFLGTLCVVVYDVCAGDLENAAMLAADLRALEHSATGGPAGALAAALVQARLAWLSGDADGARDTIGAALALGSMTGTEVGRHRLLAEAATVALSGGDRASARRWLTELRRDLPRLGRVARLHYDLAAGWEALEAGDITGALGEQERLLGASAQLGMPALQVLARLFAAQVRKAVGTPGAEVYVAQAVQAAGEMDSALLQFTALVVEAVLARRQGDDARALQALARALPIGRAHGYANTWMLSPRTMAELAALALDAEVEVDYVRRLVRDRRLVTVEAPVEVEAWPWPIKVFTLGRFEVLTDERPLQFSGKAQRKPLALLHALIALGGQRVREHRLSEVLWPDAEGDAALQALSTTLHRLRRLLGHERAILRQDGAISLVAEYCWVDLWAVERLITRAETAIARSPVRDHAWAASLRWTERALSLYRGDFLLTDPSVAEAAGVAGRIKERLLRQLRSVARVWEGIGDWEEAAEWYERGLAIDDTVEELHRRLISAYRRLNRQGEAILAYQRCRKALAAIGAEPSPETDGLVRSS